MLAMPSFMPSFTRSFMPVAFLRTVSSPSPSPSRTLAKGVLPALVSPLRALLLSLLSCLPTLAHAHEFWIEAEDYRLTQGEDVVLDFHVGQGFRGNAQNYNPARERRTALIGPEGEVPVASRIGDRPAIDQPVPGEGLLIAVHETADATLTYRDPDLFERFVEEEGLDGTLERHIERGLPPSDFREVFSRSVKALVSLGQGGDERGEEGGGEDRALGLPVEIVVEGNPYALPVPDEVRLRVLVDGAPVEGALVNVFIKPERGLGPGGEVAVEKLRTDAGGRVTLPIEPGLRYLANTVDMREASPELEADTGAVWESRWGSTTFSTAR